MNSKYGQNHKILLTPHPLPCSPRQDYYPWYEPNLADLTSVVVKDMLAPSFQGDLKALVEVHFFLFFFIIYYTNMMKVQSSIRVNCQKGVKKGISYQKTITYNYEPHQWEDIDKLNLTCLRQMRRAHGF